MVVPVTSRTPNSAPMNSRGAAIHAVSPSDSGPPIAKPVKPAALRRAMGSTGEPAHRCQRPRAGSAIMVAPRISRGRDSGWGSVRIRRTAPPMSSSGTRITAEPITRAHGDVDPSADRPRRVEPRAGGDDDGDTEQCQRDAVAAMTGFEVTRTADRPCRGSGALGQHQPTGTCTAADGGTSGTRPRCAALRAGALRAGALRRGDAGRFGALPLREAAPDLVFCVPDRLTVLLAMRVSLVAVIPFAPSATQVTVR